MSHTRSSKQALPDIQSKAVFADFHALNDALVSLGIGEEAIIPLHSEETALQVVASVESTRTLKEKSLPISYPSITKRALVRPTPTRIHNSSQGWIQEEQLRVLASGWLTLAEATVLKIMVGTTIGPFQQAYAGSVKEPDCALKISGQTFPSLTIEHDIDIWMAGTGGATIVAIIIKLNKRAPGRLADFYQVARRSLIAPAGYVMEPLQDLFPPPQNANQQVIRVSREELFGQQVQQERNPQDVWELSLDRLRANVDTNARMEGYILL
ncbi:hypothetical protein BDZ91DRAFT_813672 [Kalaharituber pfeilii]|nr:hypothetical protein BDZ91DRAFT_813672 [Kalaharituber pfeilii]